jgi:hypothetical protein
MKVVRHQAVAVEPDRIAELGAVEAVEEGAVVFVVGDIDATVVAPIDRVVERSIVGRSK